jgi:hypothetical protein
MSWMEGEVDLLERLGRLGLGALKNGKGVVALQVVVFDATGAKEQGDCG